MQPAASATRTRLGSWPVRPLDAARLLPACVAGLFLFNLWLHFPGELNNDSISQLQEATRGRYTDWDPPIMARLWSLLLPFFGQSPAPMLVLHLAGYWLGVGLLADAMRRAGHGRLAWVLVACGAFPPFLYLNAVISKDAGLVSAWAAAMGLVSWFRVQSRPLPLAAVAAVVLLLAYGTLVRTNAIFAIGPLALWAFSPGRAPGGRGLLLAAVLGALLALPTSNFINRSVLQARAQHTEHSLFLFDLHGIAVRTGDPALLEPRASFSLEQLRACYTPYWWDSLSAWGRCAARVHRPPPEGDFSYITLPEGMTVQWARAIAAHPVDYLVHRLKHFNSSLLFLVPRKHVRFTPEYGSGPDWTPIAQVSDREVRLDLLRKNPASWPAVWLVWGGFLALWLARKPGQSTGAAVPLALALAISALAYSGAYLLVGVATDMRYHFWSLLALLLATALTLPQWWRGLREGAPLLWAGAGAAAGVVVLGTAARLADWRGLF